MCVNFLDFLVNEDDAWVESSDDEMDRLFPVVDVWERKGAVVDDGFVIFLFEEILGVDDLKERVS